MASENEQHLPDRLGNIHERIEEISELEAKAAATGRWAGLPELLTEKEKLLDELHQILEKFSHGQNA